MTRLGLAVLARSVPEPGRTARTAYRQRRNPPSPLMATPQARPTIQPHFPISHRAIHAQHIRACRKFVKDYITHRIKHISTKPLSTVEADHRPKVIPAGHREDRGQPAHHPKRTPRAPRPAARCTPPQTRDLQGGPISGYAPVFVFAKDSPLLGGKGNAKVTEHVTGRPRYCPRLTPVVRP